MTYFGWIMTQQTVNYFLHYLYVTVNLRFLSSKAVSTICGDL